MKLCLGDARLVGGGWLVVVPRWLVGWWLWRDGWRDVHSVFMLVGVVETK
jgi:hypothetical protein